MKMTHAEVEAGLRNIGYPVDCGACMEVFYTGATLAQHTCARKDERVEVVVHPAVPKRIVVSCSVYRCAECGTVYTDDGLDADCPTCGPLPVPAPKVATSERNALAQIHGLIGLWRKDDDPHGRPTAHALLDEIYKIAGEGLK